MAKTAENRPAEIFGYPHWNGSREAQEARKKHWCPFRSRPCNKKSQLIDSKLPFGVCSAEHGGGIRAICPHRFEERGSLESVSRALEDVALHYFGDYNNTLFFPEVRLKNVGVIDYILVRYKPMIPTVEDFVSVEFQTDSTTGTRGLVQGFTDFRQGSDIRQTSYNFGMNTYDSIKRALTQLMNKGVIYENWGTKCYWIFQEYIYENLISRYGFKTEGFSPDHSARFVLYNLIPDSDSYKMKQNRIISTSVEEVFQAIRNKPGMPSKDSFVQHLNDKLRLKLSVRIG